MRWCTVTVTDAEGRRHSVDLQAGSLFDAAHLFVVEAKKERAVGLPKPTLATVFEVVTTGKVYRVTGAALQRWIVEKRSSWNGPNGCSFVRGRGWSSSSVRRLSAEVDSGKDREGALRDARRNGH
jgi:hypothetical protein